MDEPRALEFTRARRLDPLRRRSPGGFRTVRLNAAGWSVLVGAGLAAGGLSIVAGTPPAVALPVGVVAAWLVALVLDHVRWRNGHTGIGRDELDRVKGDEIVARLRERGIDASYEEHVFDEPDGTLYTQRSIRCRHADEAKVLAVVEEILGR